MVTTLNKPTNIADVLAQLDINPENHGVDAEDAEGVQEVFGHITLENFTFICAICDFPQTERPAQWLSGSFSGGSKYPICGYCNDQLQ